jgi:hypothetical protein
MIIQFSVRNFKAFKDQALWSMVASNYDKVTREAENVYCKSGTKLRLLKSAAVYGANGSGKTTLIEALEWMCNFVLNSSRIPQPGSKIPVSPYRWLTDSTSSTTEFEILFLLDSVQYRYGFEVNEHQIIAEWFYFKPKTKEVELFYRNELEVAHHDRQFPKGKMLVKEGLVNANVLLLSVAAQLKEAHAIKILSWFQDWCIVSKASLSLDTPWVREKLQDPVYRDRVGDMLCAADLGLFDLALQPLVHGYAQQSVQSLIPKKSYAVSESNVIYESERSPIREDSDRVRQTRNQKLCSLEKDASSGTQRYCVLCIYLLHALDKGVPILIDALDAELHTHLVLPLVDLFHSRDTNPHHAQLLFNTMDTHLLGAGLMRRDQIWFTEKNRYGAAKLYALADFKSEDVRKKESFEDNYLRGKYGAVPVLSPFNTLTIKSTKDAQKRKKQK